MAVLVRTTRRRVFRRGSGGTGRVDVATGSVRVISIGVSVLRIVSRISVRRQAAAFSLGALKFMKLITGEHGERRHFTAASRTAAVLTVLAIRVTVVTVIVAYLPSERAVGDGVRLGRSRGNGRNGGVRRSRASRLACCSFLLVGVGSAFLGISVDADVTSELITPAETLLAAGMCADVGFFAGVGANVSCLVLETVERARAKGALVRSGNLRLVYSVVASCERSSIGAGFGHICRRRLSHYAKGAIADRRSAEDGKVRRPRNWLESN